MLRISSVVGRGLAVLIASGCAASAADQTFDFRGDDPEMNDAMAAARATLPVLFENLRRPDVTGFMLKVAVDASDVGISLEHIWMTDCRAGTARQFACVVANEPHTKTVSAGELHEFDAARITDWTYFDAAGMMHGAYTMRVILPRMPEDQAASYRATLAPLPE